MKVQSKSTSMITFFALAAILVNPSFQKDAKAEIDPALVVGALSGLVLATCLRASFSESNSQSVGSALGPSLLCFMIPVMLLALSANASAQTLDNKVTERDAQLLANLPADQKARITQLGLRNASHEAIISELSSTPEGRAVMNEFLQQSRPESTPLASTRAMKPDSAQSTVPATVASNSAANLAE